MKLLATLLMIFTMMTALAQNFTDKAKPLEDASSLDPVITAAGSKKLVLLGEASHGTHEYYKWRDIISRRLITEHDFNFIAVEGDFASLYKLNQYVKNMEGAGNSAREVLSKLNRWPIWMWANEEVVALAEWLRNYNDLLPQHKKIGFYGMDVYDEWHSKEMVMDVLKKTDLKSYYYAKQQYNCFTPHKGKSWDYAHAVKDGKPDCAAATERVVEYIRSNREVLNELSDDAYFYLLQNAIVVQNAEEFFRESVASKDVASWNSRVFHMRETVGDLLRLYGENSKGIVWAHNTHIGDASFTSMRNTGEKNIGQLKRESLGKENVFLIGFSSYKGKVIAGSSWGAKMEKMKVPGAISKSIETQLKKTGMDSLFLLFDAEDRKPENLEAIGHRAIGVVYNPQFDRRQFVPTIVPMRYDALLFFKETTALRPLHR
ncbi:erythromycin esterase family protein [Aequorivita marina]|uniref:erythromycin esterase family protein n=1 Tax=Aequorivita marina TaxID=3073654 RepID=UPI0028752B80|nr:erythromycin esterase family protein [Aequorivita sp. S2608]MDS1299357.1 erythromycin esterase family protein [Aequorivita sp. S2608]